MLMITVVSSRKEHLPKHMQHSVHEQVEGKYGGH